MADSLVADAIVDPVQRAAAAAAAFVAAHPDNPLVVRLIAAQAEVDAAQAAIDVARAS